MAGTLIKTFAPVIAAVVVFEVLAVPHHAVPLLQGVRWADKHGGQQKICVGLFMCFCGGLSGRDNGDRAYRQIEPTRRALKVLFDDFKRVHEAHKKDDQDDSNEDGKAAVDALTAGELVERKVLLFLRTSDPEQTSRAMSAITSGFLAVLPSLKIKYAQAIVVGGAI